MGNVLILLRNRLTEALRGAFPDVPTDTEAVVTEATDPKFGHYQCNSAMSLAKVLRKKPREIAQQWVDSAGLEDICSAVEIAGPGFINLTLSPKFITRGMRELLPDPRLGLERVEQPERIVVDFSSPNIAKELHVGHLRSTIIGDCLARLFEMQGHKVLRRNHVGDWGTQFGMLIAHLEDVCPEATQADSKVELGDLVAFYKEAKKRFDDEELFREQARKRVVALQSGEPEATSAWKNLCEQSRRQFEEIYSILDVEIEERGESFYNPYIPETLQELDAKGLISESEGARCIFLEGFSNKEGEPLPMIVQKRDGGYNYDTTDMATIRYRVQVEKAQRIYYVTDSGQSLHFEMVFAAAKKAGWLEETQAVHVPFGMVLGEDRKKFKTRSGETVRLKDLLDEAIRRAQSIVEEKNPELDEEKKRQIAHTVGIGAVKYADLSQNRLSDYVFSFDKMLALTGNTAPYLIYAFVRVRGIARKGNLDYTHLAPDQLEQLETDEELELGKTLLRFPEAIERASVELTPNRITDYLYDLAQVFSRFYTNNRVLGDARETTRLALCDLSARTLEQGLSLLGIRVLEEM